LKATKSERGQLVIADVPIPELNEQGILAKTLYSALSTGTELMVLGQPHMDVFLGYSAVGVVEAVGNGAAHVQIGQRVACYGVPTHGEYFLANSCHITPVPEGVDSQEAAFAGIATIGVQALRQADLRFGETVVIIGLGIIGQLMAQMALAAAYRVIALDHIAERCEMLERCTNLRVCRSAEEVEEQLLALTGGRGADAVMICTGSKTHRLIDQAIKWIRDRGRVVIVGDTNTEFDRDALFAKEAQITISRAGGPGRYDSAYEEEGRDYPYGYVRWTMGRNLEEFIRLLDTGLLRIKPLITSIHALQDIGLGYTQAKENPRRSMGVLVQFIN